MAYDTNGGEAQQQREQILADAAKNKCWIGAAHISFPGLGHIVLRHGAYGWIPADYSPELDAPTR